MADHVNHLFVYGTLMRGQANHARFCGDALTIEPAVTTGILYDLPMGFPAMIEAADGQVFGEAMTFPDLQAALRRLDRLEGYRPDQPSLSMYLRSQAKIELSVAKAVGYAYCYVWRGPLPQGSRAVKSGRWMGSQPLF